MTTLTDLSDEMNRRDCLAELDAILNFGTTNIPLFLRKWGEGLRQLLIDPTDEDLINHAVNFEVAPIEDERDKLKSAIETAVEDFDCMPFDENEPAPVTLNRVAEIISTLEKALT